MVMATPERSAHL